MNPRELTQLALAGPIKADDVPWLVVSNAIEAMLSVPSLAGALSAVEPAARRGVTGAVEAALSLIGAKLAPHMSPAQTSAWLDAMLASLKRYPIKTIILAARRAIEEPFPFGLNTVDARLHELAAEIETRNSVALARLRKMADEIKRAAQPKIEQQPVEPMTVEELAALPAHLWSMGITGGFIAGEERAAAEALRNNLQCHIDASQNDVHIQGTEGKPVGDLI